MKLSGILNVGGGGRVKLAGILNVGGGGRVKLAGILNVGRGMSLAFLLTIMWSLVK